MCEHFCKKWGVFFKIKTILTKNKNFHHEQYQTKYFIKEICTLDNVFMLAKMKSLSTKYTKLHQSHKLHDTLPRKHNNHC